MAGKEKYLMKRKRYGWGFIPATWQGWLFFILQFVVVLLAASFMPAKPQEPTTAQSLRFFAIITAVISSIILVSFMTGPKPHWRWGKKRHRQL